MTQILRFQRFEKSAEEFFSKIKLNGSHFLKVREQIQMANSTLRELKMRMNINRSCANSKKAENRYYKNVIVCKFSKIYLGILGTNSCSFLKFQSLNQSFRSHC